MGELGVNLRWVGALSLIVLGCAHTPPRFDAAQRPTCLVLSVGGPDGVAHLGAIAAAKEAQLPISCVVGSSMGALVGAIYASAPGDDPRARFADLLERYAAATRSEARRNGLGLGLLFGAVAALITDGAAIPAIVASGGYAIGAEATTKLDRDRLVRVMNDYFQGRTIEALPLPFAALYQQREGNGVTVVAARTGSLAEVVGASVANPFLFPKLDVASARAIDPGADRAAAVPVEEACRLFPGHNLLAINVSGKPAFYSARMSCPLLEVTLPRAELPADRVLGGGPAYDAAVSAGFAATRAALRE